ncbi:hypothetical protein ABIB25_001882 [Nakamurella sp. UYEF19]|uniref:hypothetical protein n=1 Tax=Nakamurella sp. UYEF19 TaxID=1756392 RepID=UPI00339B03DE
MMLTANPSSAIVTVGPFAVVGIVREGDGVGDVGDLGVRDVSGDVVGRPGLVEWSSMVLVVDGPDEPVDSSVDEVFEFSAREEAWTEATASALGCAVPST